jgi:hypothetical protein
MKKFIRTMQSLSERAAELQQAIQQVPPRVAGIREALTLTTGQLQQLQAEVQTNVASLKADSQERLVEALHEVNGSTEVFQEVGYELGQVEMELTPVPRLIVHLNRVEDVPEPRLRSLASANRERRITHALLNAVMQAEAMADEVDIRGQVFYKLIVHIGPVPAVRLCWMPEVADLPTRHAAPDSQPAAPAQAPPASEFAVYGQESFFQRRTQGAPSPGPGEAAAAGAPGPSMSADDAAAPARPQSAPAAVPSVSALPASRRSGGKDWGRESLERFKKMPGVSKYQR